MNSGNQHFSPLYCFDITEAFFDDGDQGWFDMSIGAVSAVHEVQDPSYETSEQH